MYNQTNNLNQILKSFPVCTSNLDEKHRELLGGLIKEMGGTYHQNMMKSTKILISNKIDTTKCLTASEFNIPIVSIDWIKMCHKKKKLLDKKEFELKCFHGLKIFLLGFDKIQENNLKKLIEDNEGKIILNKEDADVIVIKSCLYMTSSEKNMLKEFESKIVIDKWVHDCTENRKYININFPSYKYNTDMLKNKFEKLEKEILSDKRECERNEFLRKKKKSLRYKTDNGNEENNKNIFNNFKLLFNKLIFFISPDFDKETKDILVKSISLGGGLVYKELNPYTTHIICNSTSENFNSKSISFGIYYKPEFVNPNWIIESLREKTLLSPIDYRPISSMDSMLNESNVNTKSEIYLNTTVISNIFKGQKFYIYAESYSEEEFFKIKENILQNSGEVVNSNLSSKDNTKSQNSIKANYIIINDGFSQDEMSILIERRINNYQFIMSHRYIDLCITKRTLIDLSHEKYIHVLPFQNSVPFPEFKEKQIIVFLYGFGLLEQNVMECFVETIGGVYELSKKTTHIVCKESISLEKANYYKHKYGDTIQFLGIEWLLECLIEGNVAKEEKFLIPITEETKESKKKKKINEK